MSVPQNKNLTSTFRSRENEAEIKKQIEELNKNRKVMKYSNTIITLPHIFNASHIQTLPSWVVALLFFFFPHHALSLWHHHHHPIHGWPVFDLMFSHCLNALKIIIWFTLVLFIHYYNFHNVTFFMTHTYKHFVTLYTVYILFIMHKLFFLWFKCSVSTKGKEMTPLCVCVWGWGLKKYYNNNFICSYFIKIKNFVLRHVTFFVNKIKMQRQNGVLEWWESNLLTTIAAQRKRMFDYVAYVTYLRQ